jgi:glycine/D-amino acid oxidase-like deaminating enzyme
MDAPVLIVGGGVMGSAAACFLARDFGIRSIVCERDPTYQKASSALSASSVRQQFSSPINIRLSQLSLAFLRAIGDELAVDGDGPAIGLTEPGYLYLATRAGMATLEDNHAVQVACGADVRLLDPAELNARFPWLDARDLAGASLGMRGEGWFDGYAVLQAFRRKALSLGVRYIADDVERVSANTHSVEVTTGGGRRLVGDHLLIAAGAWSAPLAAQLGFALPVSPRKRDVFVFESPAALPGCPLVIDPSGIWFRPEGRGFICGAPPRGGDPDDMPLEAVDHGLFDEMIWPTLAARVPGFEAVRLKRAWAGYYEFNRFDQNGVVGPLPGHDRVTIACGFSGHGMQHAPAVGRAIAELIGGGAYTTLDISPLSPERIVANRPLVERNVI